MMCRHLFNLVRLAALCFTVMPGFGATPLATIPISTRDRVMVPLSLNGSNDLSFLLDTGFSITMVHPRLPEALNFRRVGEVTVIGIAGEEKAPTYEGAIIKLGEVEYRPRRVAALASDGNRRRRRDGVLGAGLFRQFVVEIDFARKQLALYAPTNFNYTGRGETVPLKFRRGSSIPVVTASVPDTRGAPQPGEFEIDTGCDSSVCLGHDFIAQHQLLADRETQSGGKIGVGGGARTRNGHLPHLQLGDTRIEKPQTDFFIEGSPVDAGLAGHIGISAFNRFKVTFDYSRRQMILEPVK